MYPDDIPEDVKRRRNNLLLDVQNAISEEDNEKFIGRTVEVLVEGPSKSSRKQTGSGEPLPGAVQLAGRTPCDRIAVFDGNPRLAGSLVQVAVYGCTPTTLLGAVVTREYQHGAAPLLPILLG